jgi:leucyl-tRNA synthetase
MQINWIGQSLGAEIIFPLVRKDIHPDRENAHIKVFTTRPETLPAVQFIAVSPSHHIVKAAIENIDTRLNAYLETLPSLGPDTKEGYKLYAGYDVSHPLDPEVRIPVFVAPYVLGNYGKGAVMGVPGHDNRDHEFWKENFSKVGPEETFGVRLAVNDNSITVPELKAELTSPEGTMTELCGDMEGKTIEEGAIAIVKQLEKLDLGARRAVHRLRDWLISRQRYWGTPIPIIHCESCGIVPVPEEKLPVLLPEGDKLTRRDRSSLLHHPEWVNTTCP